MDYRIFPPESILETTVDLPASKSLAVRDILLCFLSDRLSVAAPLATVCADTRTIYDILAAGIPTDGSTVDVGPAGTAMRFLTALFAATEGADVLITGTERMCQRPVGALVDALRELGADITYKGEEGFPPLLIKGKRLTGGTVTINASVSSQFVSALMMVGPLMASPLTILLQGNVMSLPYIEMTSQMMLRYGIKNEVDRDKVVLSAGKYSGAYPQVEADWSAAAFWYEIAALTAGWVTIEHLKENTLQGDRMVAPLFERLGVLTEFTEEGAELSATPDLYSTLEADLSDMPDTAPALAVTAALAGLRFRLTGVGALRDKECDRLQALVEELRKIGVVADIENYGNTLVWEGGRVPVLTVPSFNVHGDHRMAMALAPAAVFYPGVKISNAEVVEKSYPGFWQALQKAGFVLIDTVKLKQIQEAKEKEGKE